MAVGVIASLSLSVAASLEGAQRLGGASASFRTTKQVQLAAGTQLDQADLMFADEAVLAANASAMLDLNGGWQSPLGQVNQAAQVTILYVECVSGSIKIGGSGSNYFNGPLSAGGSYALGAGEFVVFASRSGYSVTNGSADILALVAGASGGEYKVLILARSLVPGANVFNTLGGSPILAGNVAGFAPRAMAIDARLTALGV